MAKKLMIRVLIAILASFFYLETQAQFTPCQNPNGSIVGYPCPDDRFFPVCGCDNQTYRNTCDAQMRNGINFWTDGTCTGFEIDIIPNFTNTTPISFTFVQNKEVPATLAICNSWGKIIFQMSVPPVQRFEYEFQQVSTFFPGVYFFLVYNRNGDYRYKKFVCYGQ